jgi:hypothetical protein
LKTVGGIEMKKEYYRLGYRIGMRSAICIHHAYNDYFYSISEHLRQSLEANKKEFYAGFRAAKKHGGGLR